VAYGTLHFPGYGAFRRSCSRKRFHFQLVVQVLYKLDRRMLGVRKSNAERGESMRTFALSSVAALAISMMASAGAWAWSTEQASPNTSAGAAYADPDEAFKALQDKVNGKTNNTQSGFYVSGGAGQQPFGSPYRYQSTTQPDGTVPFGYSPMPGFRGQPQ
jgi:hypothetical protein